MKSAVKYCRIERAYLREAEKAFEIIEDQFIIKVKTPVRVIDGTAILIKHVPTGKILDVGCGQAEVFSTLKQFNKHDVYVCDDFKDDWHLNIGQGSILHFLENRGLICTVVDNAGVKLPYNDAFFNGVFCCDVIEHLHHTPRFLMQEIYRVLQPNGIVIIGMPNSVNFRKRIDVIRGRTNYISFDRFWEGNLEYRGHIREYNPHETWRMLEYSQFTPLCAYMLDWQVTHRITGFFLNLWKMISLLFPSIKDSYLVVGIKK